MILFTDKLWIIDNNNVSMTCNRSMKRARDAMRLQLWYVDSSNSLIINLQMYPLQRIEDMVPILLNNVLFKCSEGTSYLGFFSAYI